LEKKLSFLEELEKTKSPVEEAYKDWWGEYPGDENWTSDATRWQGFQAGYNAAYEEKVSEWEPTPQTPEQVADGLKEAFREAVKQGVVSSTKSPTLYDVIAEWWEYLEDTLNMENSIQDLVNDIEEWLPTEHETNSYKWNECIRMIRGKLR
jgi:flagellar biosynthesis/type III secretory pathway protein FliH